MLPFGCGAAAKRDQLASPYPLDRARAAVHLAEAGDSGAVDLLVELLNDHDRGVRMYSILALERLCGDTYGYRYYDPEPRRAAAVARWRQARQGGQVALRSAVPENARSGDLSERDDHSGAGATANSDAAGEGSQ